MARVASNFYETLTSVKSLTKFRGWLNKPTEIEIERGEESGLTKLLHFSILFCLVH